MSEVICISFTPSHEYREHIQRRYLNERSFGATAGDSYWLGLGTYDVVDPYARYRDDERKPITHPLWRARIEKHKRLRLADSAQWRVRDMAAALQPSVVKAFLKALNNGES
jgi:hypothetical protein